MAADPSSIYWADAGDGSIYSVAIPSGTPTSLVTGLLRPRLLIEDAQDLLFSADDGIFRVAKGGGPTELVSAAINVERLAVSPLGTFWAEAQRIWWLPSDSSEPQLLFTEDEAADINGLAADSRYAYWSRHAYPEGRAESRVRRIEVGVGPAEDLLVSSSMYAETYADLTATAEGLVMGGSIIRLLPYGATEPEALVTASSRLYALGGSSVFTWDASAFWRFPSGGGADTGDLVWGVELLVRQMAADEGVLAWSTEHPFCGVKGMLVPP